MVKPGTVKISAVKSSAVKLKGKISEGPKLGLEFEGFNADLLKALHILTRDGQLNQDSRRKLKQVKHLLQFITPLLDQAKATGLEDLCLVDHGAGKSYLGFMLWNAWFAKHGGSVVGIEIREALVQQSRNLAEQFGFRGMHFLNMAADQALASKHLPERVDVVTALHACDSATDDAIAFGLERKASHIVVVPCCQAEVASVLRSGKSITMKKSALSEMWRHPLHTREFGAQITNVMRCLRLEASGYKVSVTELVGWEHSMKNELIVASRHPDVARGKARARLAEIIDEVGLNDIAGRFAVLD
jgi:Methyltransferase domain